MALDCDRDSWNNLQKKISNASLEEKKIMLRNHYADKGIIKKSEKLLLNFENKCKDIIKSLPSTIHSDMTVLLNMILKRKK